MHANQHFQLAMTMHVSPRDVLNRLKWTEGERLSDAIIYYVSRGSPGDSASARGSEIKRLEPFGLEMESGSYIPYHRIYRIDYLGEAIFEKTRYQYAFRP